jgi:glycosyltransferase involved in cell wall biosynthesis
MQKLFLEPSNFVEVREKYGYNPNDKIVLMISDANFHDPRKGMELGLDLFCAAQKILPDLQLLFVGRSPKDAFSKIKNVHNWGFIRDDSILRDAYILANCTLVPSKIDNFPQTSTESQSTGTPVVLFDTGGCAETILAPNLTGQVVPTGDLNKFIDSLVQFANVDVAQHITNRTKIQSLAQMKWSSEEIQKQFQDLLQKKIHR